MNRLFFSLILLFTLTAVPQTALAQEDTAASGEVTEEPSWASELGLSYLATSGNSDSETLGIDFEMTRRPMPWGLEFTVQSNRVEQDGEKTTERYFAGVRGTRSVAERWETFVGLSGEQDEFAGLDLRAVFEVGAVYKALLGPRHKLDLDFALTWTDEDRLAPEVDDSWIGALLGADYELAISDHATFGQTLKYYPNFDNSSDWRLETVSSLTAALNNRLALRLSQEFRYRNEPIGVNDDTDSTTKVSLVLSM